MLEGRVERVVGITTVDKINVLNTVRHSGNCLVIGLSQQQGWPIIVLSSVDGQQAKYFHLDCNLSQLRLSSGCRFGNRVHAINASAGIAMENRSNTGSNSVQASSSSLKWVTMAESLKPTPLFTQHQQLNARMMGFGGWDMPVQYQGITAEHQCVRQKAGMFDISHMGKFLLEGANLRETLQPLVPSDLSQLEPGQAKYSVFLNEQAGIVDDLIFYFEGHTDTGNEKGKLIVNASTTVKDKDWLLDHVPANEIGFEDVTDAFVLIAIQGPEAIATLQALTPTDLKAIRNYRHQSGSILDQPAWFARTGYTGEDGFEVLVDPDTGQRLWQTLLDAGVAPCGLGARDTLRLEAAMALYGQDINDTTTPYEAGLGWLVDLDKGDFIGADVLRAQHQEGPQRKLVGLQMQGRHIARHDYPIIANNQEVGIVTSGSFSPTLGKAIALAYVPINFAKSGTELTILIRNKPQLGTVVKKPFYRRPKLK